jgi:hypothetical protein
LPRQIRTTRTNAVWKAGQEGTYEATVIRFGPYVDVIVSYGPPVQLSTATVNVDLDNVIEMVLDAQSLQLLRAFS